MSRKIEDLSVVKLKDGRTGTIVHVFQNGTNALIEIEKPEDSRNDVFEISINDVEEVIWKP